MERRAAGVVPPDIAKIHETVHRGRASKQMEVFVHLQGLVSRLVTLEEEVVWKVRTRDRSTNPTDSSDFETRLDILSRYLRKQRS